MQVKTSYPLSQSRSFKRALKRITLRHVTHHEQNLKLKFRVDTAAVWQDVLTEFKLNRRIRRHIMGVIKSCK